MAVRTSPGGTSTSGTGRSSVALADQRDRTPADRVGRVEVTVGTGTRHAAEEGPRPDLPAVELDRLDFGRRRIAAQADHVDVVKQVGHVHRAVIQNSGDRRRLGRFRTGPI